MGKIITEETDLTGAIQYTGENFEEVLNYFYPKGAKKKERNTLEIYLNTFIKKGDWMKKLSDEPDGFIEIFTPKT